MSRRLSIVACAVSLLLWAAVMLLWARGETWRGRLYHYGTNHTYGIESGGGVLTLIRRDPDASEPRWRVDEVLEYPWDNNLFNALAAQAAPGVLGFRYARDRDTGGWQDAGQFLTIPMWFLCLIPATVFALFAAARWRRARRAGRGRCLACGYDLRASKDRCPECGTPVVSASGANA